MGDNIKNIYRAALKCRYKLRSRKINEMVAVRFNTHVGPHTCRLPPIEDIVKRRWVY